MLTELHGELPGVRSHTAWQVGMLDYSCAGKRQKEKQPEGPDAKTGTCKIATSCWALLRIPVRRDGAGPRLKEAAQGCGNASDATPNSARGAAQEGANHRRPFPQSITRRTSSGWGAANPTCHLPHLHLLCPALACGASSPVISFLTLHAGSIWVNLVPSAHTRWPTRPPC